MHYTAHKTRIEPPSFCCAITATDGMCSSCHGWLWFYSYLKINTLACILQMSSNSNAACCTRPFRVLVMQYIRCCGLGDSESTLPLNQDLSEQERHNIISIFPLYSWYKSMRSLSSWSHLFRPSAPWPGSRYLTTRCKSFERFIHCACRLHLSTYEHYNLISYCCSQ